MLILPGSTLVDHTPLLSLQNSLLGRAGQWRTELGWAELGWAGLGWALQSVEKGVCCRKIRPVGHLQEW